MSDYPAHPECVKKPGSIVCLHAALPICVRCPWWTSISVDPDELEAELANCVWPKGWGR